MNTALGLRSWDCWQTQTRPGHGRILTAVTKGFGLAKKIVKKLKKSSIAFLILPPNYGE